MRKRQSVLLTKGHWESLRESSELEMEIEGSLQWSGEGHISIEHKEGQEKEYYSSYY